MQSCKDTSRRARFRPTHRPWPRCSLLAGCSLVFGHLAAGCLASKYSVDEQRSEISTGGAPALSNVALRYCSSLLGSEADASHAQDWSCVSPKLRSAADTQGVAITGRFLSLSNQTVFDRLDYCPISLSSCNDTHSPLPEVAFTSTQTGCGIIHWHEGDVSYSATMWHTITHASSFTLGTVPLLDPGVVQLLASALSMPITQPGSALIGIRDCTGTTAHGVKFAARNTSDQLVGVHFSIQNDFSIPTTGATGASGLGGLVNLPPGGLTVYAYVADGCIVAEAKLISEVSRIAYVYLIPNGYGESP